MTKDEALRMALEGAANYIDTLGGDSRKYREVLAQPERPAVQGEPVAWEYCEEIYAKGNPELNDYIRANGIPLYTTPQPAVPDGWKLVPVEPTEEMCKAGYMAKDKWPNHMCDNQRELHLSFSEPRWKAMLAAALQQGESK